VSISRPCTYVTMEYSYVIHELDRCKLSDKTMTTISPIPHFLAEEVSLDIRIMLHKRGVICL
jgi:hypothetical protein